jgi:DNA-binding LytR/AlgR family response regulator
MNKNIFIRNGRKYQRIDSNEILYIEGRRNYLRIVTSLKFYMVLIPMKRLEELLPSSSFVRIHKSYIVAINKVNAFDHKSVSLENIDLPVGGVYKHALERLVAIASAEPGVLLPMHGAYRKKHIMAG